MNSFTPPEISRFAVLEKLGSGPSGIVYRAWDDQRQRPVALKWLHPDVIGVTSIRTRILALAHRQTELEHPGICTIYEVFASDGNLALVSEISKCKSLKEAVAQGNCALTDFLSIAQSLSETLEYAHMHNLVHGNLKPENVFVDNEQNIFLTDFGLNTYPDVYRNQHEHPPAESFHFLAPEQLHNGPTTPQTDFFACGSLFYWMVSGQFPFAGEIYEDIVKSLQECRPNYQSFIDRDVPGEVILLIKRLLQEAPIDRPESARELVVTVSAVQSFEREALIRENFFDVRPHSSRQYLIMSVLALLLIILWLVVTTVKS